MSVKEPMAISTAEAFRLLGIGRTLGWRLVYEGTIRTVRLGDRHLVPVSELERLLNVQDEQVLESGGSKSGVRT